MIETLEVGGAEESLVAGLPILRELGCENMVAYLAGAGTLIPKIDKGTRVLALGGPGGRLGQAARLARAVRAYRPQVIHTSLFWADQLGRVIGRFFGLPVVSSFVNTSYEPARLVDNPNLSARKLEIVRRADAFTARFASHFIAISEAAAESNAVRLGIPRSRISVVYRGRDPEQFAVDPMKARRRLVAELDLDPDAVILLNVGRLIAQKGQRYLIQAMPRVLERHPRSYLLIAGEGRLRPELESLIETNSLRRQVRLLGRRSDVPDLVAAADLFLFPSLYEGLGGAVIEAMLAAKPIIASDILVLRECLGDRDPDAFAPVGDSPAWANAIAGLLSHRERLSELGAANRTFALERYSLSSNACRQYRVYERVVANAGPGAVGS